MLDAINQIEEYMKSLSLEEFQNSRLVQDAVIREIGIIGEAARKISLPFQQAHPEITWSEIIGMRNILIHEYFEVDVQEVWKTVQSDLPLLKEQIKHVIQTIEHP
ncbi:DUF86 domain-containing protein [Candidatus Acetothermia bacterium]|nr:DUF86 domain-containing protein [Candidatus Acetothermia bacterium]MBI3459315.1 DUF86 domain-containing protein [Candidatus Acetothermia bacterium]